MVEPRLLQPGRDGQSGLAQNTPHAKKARHHRDWHPTPTGQTHSTEANSHPAAPITEATTRKTLNPSEENKRITKIVVKSVLI
jgi:hypothetical protein